MTKKLIPRLKKGKKLLKGEDGTPILISMGPANEYSMTRDGQFALLDPNTGKWRYFDDMATRDSLEYQWYPFETTAPASAFSNGVPNREDPYYKKALELAEKQKKANKKPNKKEKGGIMKGLNDLDTSNISGSGIILEKIRNSHIIPELRKIQEKIGSGTDAMTKYDMYPSYKDENAINRLLVAEINREEINKLLSRNIGKYGLLSKRRALLNNQSEIQPITSGEELIRNMPTGYNTAPRLKKGSKLK